MMSVESLVSKAIWTLDPGTNRQAAAIQQALSTGVQTMRGLPATKAESRMIGQSRATEQTFLVNYLIQEAAMRETITELERAREIAMKLEEENAHMKEQLEDLMRIADLAYDRDGEHNGCVEASDIEIVITKEDADEYYSETIEFDTENLEDELTA